MRINAKKLQIQKNLLLITIFLTQLVFLNFIIVKSLHAQTVGTFVKSDYSSGKYSTLSNFTGTPNFTNKTYSGDISVFTYKNFVYLLEVASVSKIYKFSINDNETDLFTYNGEDGYPLDQTNGVLSDDLCTGSFATSGSNPISIDFVSDTKAYLVLYNYSKILIVNPSATNLADFKLGEIDFTSYADGDLCPETRAVKILNGKAYFSLQLLNRDNSWAVENDAKILTIDTNTDTIINELTTNGLRNPNSEIKIKNNKIFISFEGPTYPLDETFGGLISLNSTNNTYNTLVNNTAITHFDFYNNNLYFLHYKGWGDISLEKVNIDNPQTPDIAFGFDGGQNLFGLLIENDKLWVLDRSSSNGGFHIVNLSTEEINSYTLSENLPYSIAHNDTNSSIAKFDNTDINIYPNPSKNMLFLKSKSLIEKVEIKSISGQEIKRIKTNKKNLVSINISELSSGIYILKISTSNETIIKKLVVK